MSLPPPGSIRDWTHISLLIRIFALGVLFGAVAGERLPMGYGVTAGVVVMLIGVIVQPVRESQR
jgi:hypothetical protein